MTTVDDTLAQHADYLEALANAIRDINQRFSAQDRAELQARLGVAGPARGGLVPGATGQGLMGGFLGGYSGGPSGPGTASAAAMLGNVLPFIGQTNVLDDPTFETLATSGSFGAPNGRWLSHFVPYSGVSPSVDFIRELTRALPNLNPFNSAVALLRASTFGSNAANFDLYIYPDTDFMPVGPVLPYLVCAVRAYIDAAVSATIDTAEATLELYDVTDATVVASSQTVDLKTLAIYEPVQLVAAAQDTAVSFRSKAWRWRLKLHVVKPASTTGTVRLLLAEPQMHFSYTPDPTPFMPAIANWFPPSLTADPVTLTSGDTIAPPAIALFLPLTLSSGATMTSTPTIAGGNDGQELILYNNTALSGSIILQDEGTLTGSNLRLTASTLTLAPRQSVRLMFYAALTDWIQVGPVVPVL